MGIFVYPCLVSLGGEFPCLLRNSAVEEACDKGDSLQTGVFIQENGIETNCPLNKIQRGCLLNERGGHFFTEVEKNCLLAIVDFAKCPYQCNPIMSFIPKLKEYNFYIFPLSGKFNKELFLENYVDDRMVAEFLLKPFTPDGKGILEKIAELAGHIPNSDSTRNLYRMRIGELISWYYRQVK